MAETLAAHPAPDTLIDGPAAAEMLGVRVQTLEAWRCHRRYPLPYVRIGRSIRHRVGDIAAFIAARTVRPVALCR